MIRNGKQVVESEIDPVDAEFTALGDHIRHLRMQVKALADACELAHEEIRELGGPNTFAPEGYPPTETDALLQKMRAALVICGRWKNA